MLRGFPHIIYDFDRRLKQLVFMVVLLPCFTTHAQVCSGNLGDPVFVETFGTGIREDLNTTSFGTTSYCYEDGTGSDCVADTNSYMSCNEHTLFSGDAQELNPFWVTGPDHTGDIDGMYAVFNAAFEANEFYRRTVDNLCGGTVFEFAAWIANLYDPMNTPGPCTDNNGDGLYPNVTFEIRNPITDDLIVSLPTGNILPTIAQGLPNNIEWKQLGITFEMPAGLSSVNIVMRNNGDGGCGNDLAIDDITLRPCGPRAEIDINNLAICADRTATFIAEIGAGFTDPFILWQSWDSASMSWQSVGLSGPASQGFDEIELTDLQNEDSIRYIVAGDAISLNNPNCPITSDILVVSIEFPTMAVINDTIRTILDQLEDNVVCIEQVLDLEGTIEEVIICGSPTEVDFSFDQQDNTLCFNFSREQSEEGQDELCIIVCDDLPCSLCDTTIIQLSYELIVDTSQCFVPNVITPNGDNLNDVFYVNCLESVDGALLVIYNRWGNEVYENINYQNDWDGFYRNKALPDGIYYYVLQFRNREGEDISLAGDVSILR